MEKKYSILIVDDQQVCIMALSQILGADYNIYSATNGLDGIAAAEKHLPDVVLLDVHMPGMDGYEVITRLKESSLTKSIPVIFITSLDGEEEGLSLGAADYITKMFNPGVIKLRVSNQIKIVELLRTIERLTAKEAGEEQ
jgi:PleD family two-component response regulator